MKSLIITALLAFSTICLTAQWGDNHIKLSENITTETKDITGFDKIDVSEDFEVFIRFSDTAEKVEIEANENLHDMIQVEKEGGTLKIWTKPYSTGGIGKWRGAQEKLVAYITANSLSEIRGDEDVVIELKDKLRTDKLSIILSEDCTLEGELEVNELIVDLDEDCTLNIEGSTRTMQAKANEDCYIKGKDFTVGDLEIELVEDSEAKLNVTGDIDLLAREDSYFYHNGNGNFTRKKLRGDSEIKRW